MLTNLYKSSTVYVGRFESFAKNVMMVVLGEVDRCNECEEDVTWIWGKYVVFNEEQCSITQLSGTMSDCSDLPVER